MAPQRCGCGRDRHAFQVANRLMAHLRFEVAWVPASAGMTFFGRARFTMRSDRRPGTYPRCLARVASCGYRCLRRDVGGPIHRPRGNGRRPEGERNGSRSGRPGGNRFRRGVSNGAGPATALAAQGAMAHAPATVSGRRKPKLCPGTKIAGAGAERQPRDREVPGSPSTRLSGRLARVSRGVIAPGLPSRHPRTRRTSGPTPETDGACAVGRTPFSSVADPNPIVYL